MPTLEEMATTPKVRPSQQFTLDEMASIPKVDAEQEEYRPAQIGAAPEPSLLKRGIERATEYVRERTGLFEPPIYGEQFREEKPVKTLIGAAGFYGAKILSGLGLYVPDIIAGKVSSEKSLADLVNKATGFQPTPKEIGAGESAEFIGGLKTAGGVTGKLIKGIAARQALKTILASGLTFATRRVAKEVADKIITGDPIDFEGIHFEGGIGVLFGIGEVGVQSLADFIGGIRTSSGAERIAVRQEVQSALGVYRKTGDRTAWDAVRNKYMGLSPEVAARAAPPPPVERFGEYPLGRPMARATIPITPVPKPPEITLTMPAEAITPPVPKISKAKIKPSFMPEHERVAPSVLGIESSIGKIHIPEADLTGKYGIDLKRIFDYGNFQTDVPQPNLRRSLSVGDTINYRGHTLMVYPFGWRDVTGLSTETIKAIGESPNVLPLDASWRQAEAKLATEPPAPTAPKAEIRPAEVAPPRGRVAIWTEKLYQSFVNRFASIENITKRAQKLGMTIRPGENPTLRARGYLGMGRKAESVIEDSTYRITPEGKIEITGEGLRPILKDFERTTVEKNTPVAERDLKDYLIARRTIQDLQRPKYEGSTDFIATPEQVKQAQTRISELQGKYGNNIGVFDQTATRLYDYQKRVLHTLVEGGNLSERQYQEILKRNPNYVPFDRIMDDIEGVTGVPKTKQLFTGARAPIRKIKGSQREIHDPIESIIKNTYRIMDAAERNTVARTIVNLQQTFPEEIVPRKITTVPVAEEEGRLIFRPSQFKPKGNVIEYFEDGKRRYVEVTPNLYDAMSGLNETSSGLLINILSKPASWLRTGATMTPEFMIRNPIRDQQSALMQTSFGFVPFVDSGKATADILGKTDVYYDWIRSGGAYSGFVELSRPQLEMTVKELVKGKSLLSRLNIIVDAQDISQLGEQATRLAVYKKAVVAGKTPIEAGFESREATVDFGRRGSRTKEINKVIAFFNAGIQGVDKTARTFVTHPVSATAKGIALITIPQLLLYLHNRKDPDYKEIPRWQKDLFFVTKVPGTNVYARIPKGFLYGQIFGSIPERFFEYLDTKDPAAFDRLAQSTYDALLPTQGDPASGLLATGIKPIIENITNYSFFRQVPILPEGVKDLEPAEQYTRYTSETAKQVGKILGYSPAKIENLLQGYIGGTARYVTGAGDFLINKIREAAGKKVPVKPTRGITRYPGVYGLAFQPPIETGQAESINKFYENRDKLAALQKTFNKMVNEGRKEEARKFIQKNPQLNLAADFTSTAREMSELSKRIDMIMFSEKLNAQQKADKIRQIEKQRVALAQRTNKLLR